MATAGVQVNNGQPQAHIVQVENPTTAVKSRKFEASKFAFTSSLFIMQLIAFIFALREGVHSLYVENSYEFPDRKRIPLSDGQIMLLAAAQVASSVVVSMAKEQLCIIIVYIFLAILVSFYYFAFIISPTAGALCFIHIFTTVIYAHHLRLRNLRQH